MKKQSLSILLAIFFISASNIVASSLTAKLESMNFDIPFEFHVGDQKFAPGKYRVDVDPSSSLLILTDGEGNTKRFIGAIRSGKRTKNKTNRLIFNKYSENYFLRSVDAPSHSSRLNRSKSEKKQKKSGSEKIEVTS